MAINVGRINFARLNGAEASTLPPPPSGSGSIIALEQWIVPFAKINKKTPINSNRIGTATFAGEMLLIGSGDLIVLNQSVGQLGSGREISVAQSVGLLGPSGNEIVIEQAQQAFSSGTGTMINIEQNIATMQSGSIIDIEQRIINNAIVTHLQKFGWDAIVTLNRNEIPTSQITGEIKIDRSENQASLAEVTIIPPSGFVDAEFYTGKSITIDVHTEAGLKRIYTGIVDIPELDLLEKKITLKCTDRRTELVNAQFSITDPTTLVVTPTATLESIGYFSPLIFQNIKDTADELDKRLSTIPYSVDFDAFGNYTLTSWFAKTLPDFTFTDSDVYYERPKIQIGSRGRVTNQINMTFQYRYDRLQHTDKLFVWNSPIKTDIMLLLENGYSLTFRERVKSAADATGWPLKGAITYTPIWPSGWYNNIAWSTVQLTFSTANATQSSFDPVSGQTTVSTTDSTTSFTDTSGNVVTANAVTGGTDFGPIYCMGATWRATFRWAQTITEFYSLQVTAPQSVAQYEVIDTTESYSTQSTFSPTVWENYKSYTSAATALALVPGARAIVGNPDGAYYINADTNRTDMQHAATTVLNKAKTTILGTHRDTKVIVNTFLFPDIDLKHTLKVDTSTVIAKGKVYAIEHTLNVESGEAITTTTIALFKAQGSTSNTSLVLPAIAADSPDTTSGNIILGNHFGQDPTTVAGRLWNGMIGNRYPPGGLGRTTYPEYFKVDVPAIPDSLRQARNNYGTHVYNVLIPDDLLTIIF